MSVDPLAVEIKSVPEFHHRGMDLITDDVRLNNTYQSSRSPHLAHFLSLGEMRRMGLKNFGKNSEQKLRFALARYLRVELKEVEAALADWVPESAEEDVPVGNHEGGMPPSWDRSRKILAEYPTVHGDSLFWITRYAGAKWPFNRREETIGQYLDKSRADLKNSGGWGPKKLEALEKGARWLAENPDWKQAPVTREGVYQELDFLIQHLDVESRAVLDQRIRKAVGQRPTLEEVARGFGLTRERVRQLEGIVLEELRSPRLVNMLKEAFQELDDEFWKVIAGGRPAFRIPVSQIKYEQAFDSEDIVLTRIVHGTLKDWLDSSCKRVENGWYRTAYSESQVEEAIFLVETFSEVQAFPLSFGDFSNLTHLPAELVSIALTLSDTLEFDGTLVRRENRSEEKWDQRIEELKEYYKVHGHVNVPRSFNPELGSWVQATRARYKDGKLSREKIATLDQYGFKWKMRDRGTWEENFERYKEQWLALKSGKLKKLDKDMAQFAINERSYRRRGMRALDRIQKLDGIGFDWGDQVAAASCHNFARATE